MNRPPNIPESFETERLLIRVPRPGDGPEMNAAILETFDSLHIWMPWAALRPTVEENEANIRQALVNFREGIEIRLSLFLKGTETLVGCSGLHNIHWGVPRFEIGYWCRKRFEGQGYITEAVRGITRFAIQELGAKRVEIRCDSRNERSRRVAERAGYRLEGVLRRENRTIDGLLRDTMVFSILPEEFRAWGDAALRG